LILIGRQLNGSNLRQVITLMIHHTRCLSIFDDSPYKMPLHLGSAPVALMLPPINCLIS
jgi:hypothetical protein